MEKTIKKISATKLSYMIIIVALSFLVIYTVIQEGKNTEIAKIVLALFSNIAVSMVSFYFGQKSIKVESTDGLLEFEIKKEEKKDEVKDNVSNIDNI